MPDQIIPQERKGRKKLLLTAGALLLVAILVLGIGFYLNNARRDEPPLPLGRVYKLDDPSLDWMWQPTVTLEKHHRFTMYLSALHSYLPHGSYRIQDNLLTLKTDDDLYTYTFQIEEDEAGEYHLIYQKEASSEIIQYVPENTQTTLPDGAVFR